MSFVNIVPEILGAAVHDMRTVGSAVSACNAPAPQPTSGLIPAAAQEVSALTAAQRVAHAQTYDALSTQAAASHQEFVTAFAASAVSDAATEAANAVAAS